MNSRSLFFLEKLKDALSNDERLLCLERLEEQVDADAEISALSKESKHLVEEYEALSSTYGKTSEIAKEKWKTLAEHQRKCNETPLASAYNDAYREVSTLYLSINDILFGDVVKYPFGGKRD